MRDSKRKIKREKETNMEEEKLGENRRAGRLTRRKKDMERNAEERPRREESMGWERGREEREGKVLLLFVL